VAVRNTASDQASKYYEVNREKERRKQFDDLAAKIKSPFFVHFQLDAFLNLPANEKQTLLCGFASRAFFKTQVAIHQIILFWLKFYVVTYFLCAC
jgi:hypothetical protein